MIVVGDPGANGSSGSGSEEEEDRQQQEQSEGLSESSSGDLDFEDDVRACVCVCVCVHGREREKENEMDIREWMGAKINDVALVLSRCSLVRGCPGTVVSKEMNSSVKLKKIIGEMILISAV